MIEQYKASFPLQKQFITNADGNGLQVFTQLKREGEYAIYHRTTPEEGLCRGYEVIQIKVVKAGTVYAKGATPTEKATESYPGKSSFGKLAWSCVNLERAEEKFDALVTGFDEEQAIQAAGGEKPKKGRRSKIALPEVFKFPEGEFTIKDFTELNNLPPIGKGYLAFKGFEAKKKVKLVKQVKGEGRGRPKGYYIVV
jgi:hypothetical protein